MTGRDPLTIVHVLDPVSLQDRAMLRQRRVPGVPCTDAAAMCCVSAVREMQQVDAGLQHEYVVVGSAREEQLLARCGINTSNRINRSAAARSLRRYLRDRFDSSDSCIVCCWSSTSLYALASELPDVRVIGIVLDDPGLTSGSPMVYLDPPFVDVPDALPSCSYLIPSPQHRDTFRSQWRQDNEVPDNACVLALLGSHAHTEPPFQFAMLLGRLAACGVDVIGAARCASEPVARFRQFERATNAACIIINEPERTVIDQLLCADIAVSFRTAGTVPVAHEVSIALAMGVPIVIGSGVVSETMLPDVHKKQAVALANDPSAMARPLLKLLDDMALCQPLIDAGVIHDPTRDERFARSVLELVHAASPMRV
ncbi:MAG: hypothetical protein H6815_01130 [Phycisphaeraceae bacterium]|nr:hypothetical protein [Phycisphaerales bacterium]MCB9859029.1 hypothetical protein [Phycisphaeraceae bacterium]